MINSSLLERFGKDCLFNRVLASLPGLPETIKRIRLRRQGLAARRRRLSQRKLAIWGKASESFWLRFSLIGVFTLLVTALVVWPQEVWGWQSFLGAQARTSLVMVGITLLILLLMLPEMLERNERLSLFLGLLLSQLILAEVIGSSVQSENRAIQGFVPFILPHALAPLLLTLLAGERAGSVVTLLSAFWQALILDAANPWAVAGSACLVGFGSVLLASELRNRRMLIRTGVLISLIHLACAWMFGHLSMPLPGDFWQMSWLWQWLLVQVLLALAAGVATTLSVMFLLPLFEGIFRLTSAPTWLELTDLNHPLLRRLSLEAPGTYHHSLQVATLAEAAAEAVGADATRARVCAYFHDIGKLGKPNYFIENQGEDNPHDQLTPTMSALVILAHVKDGVSLALKHHLNGDIIDVIKEHHGTSLVGYFYHRALQQQKDALEEVKEGKRNEDDVPRVSPESFRYPGPRPRSAESAIIGLADSIESASRSLDKPTPHKLEQLVGDIFTNRLSDGQLDECGLTMSELRQVRDSFTERLRTINHHRVSYPEDTVEKVEGEAVEVVPAEANTWGGRSNHFAEAQTRRPDRAGNGQAARKQSEEPATPKP